MYEQKFAYLATRSAEMLCDREAGIFANKRGQDADTPQLN